MFRSWPSYVEPHHRLLQISCRTIVPSFKYRNAVLYVYQFNNLVLLFVTTTYEMIFATPCNGVCRGEDIVITDLMCSHIHLWVIIDLQLWIGEENTSLDHFNSKVKVNYLSPTLLDDQAHLPQPGFGFAGTRKVGQVVILVVSEVWTLG